MSTVTLDGVSSIQDVTPIAAHLGFSYTKPVKSSSINAMSMNGLYFSFNMAPDPITSAYTVETWQFGAKQTSSFGYAFTQGEEAGIYLNATRAPITFYSYTLSGLRTDTLAPSEADKLRYFEGSLRFGESAAASISFRVVPAVSINAGFDWSQVYERHMFWYWALSGVMEGITDGVATWFAKAIGKSAPGALPIMHFILRNGVAMGFKALRKNQMNWPFETAAPLNYMGFNAGVSIIF
jgi:hypothetical protein